MKNVILGKGVYVSPLAHLSGDITAEDNCSFWPGASVRGDRSSVFFGEGTNVQDNATVHSEASTPVRIGRGVTIGHNAVVHGATVGDNVVIGMGAIVLDGAVIGKNSIIGAGAVIGGRKVIPENSVVVGNPFRVLREATEEDAERNRRNAEEYVEAAKEYRLLGL